MLAITIWYEFSHLCPLNRLSLIFRPMGTRLQSRSKRLAKHRKTECRFSSTSVKCARLSHAATTFVVTAIQPKTAQSRQFLCEVTHLQGAEISVSSANNFSRHQLHGRVSRKSLGRRFGEAFLPTNHTTTLSSLGNFCRTFCILSDTTQIFESLYSHTRFYSFTPYHQGYIHLRIRLFPRHIP